MMLMKQITIKKTCGLCKRLDYMGWCSGNGFIVFNDREICNYFIPADWVTEISRTISFKGR